MQYSIYYQAHVKEKDTWFLVATLRSFEHLVFDRTLSKETRTFEFFVPPAQEETFSSLMQYYTREGIVTNLVKLPNRLLDPSETV